jgi:hypothetical protein
MVPVLIISMHDQLAQYSGVGGLSFGEEGRSSSEGDLPRRKVSE